MRTLPTRQIVSALNKRLAVAVALLAVLLLVSLPGVSAHGYIVRAIPEDRAALDRPPVRVQYWFSESLEPDYSSVTVRDSSGAVVAEGGVDPDDRTLLSARLPTNLPDGAYLSELKIAFSSDGHVIYDTRAFFVGVSADAGFGGAGASDLPVTLEMVWRALVNAAHTLLFGGFALYALVLVPAWGSDAHPAGLLPPRVMRRLYTIIALSLGIAFAGNILALLQQTMVFFNADLGRVISENLWSVVRVGTRFGDTWSARMILLVIVAGTTIASVIYRKEQPTWVRAFFTANIWAMALVLGSMSIASHAAGSLTLTWIAVFNDWAHLLGTGFWAGAITALALVLPRALSPLNPEDRRAALLAALNRFSPLAAGSVIVVIATGIYASALWFTEPDDVPTPYGGALAIKLALVGLLLGLSALHHMALRPAQYTRFERLYSMVGSFGGSLRVEAVLVIAVLFAVGLLSATPPPEPELAGRSIPPPRNTQVNGQYLITTTITPGGPGVNTYDVLVTRLMDNQPVENAVVRLQLSDPARDWRGTPHELESIGDGLYASAGADLSNVGVWWAAVDVLAENSGWERAAFAFAVNQEAAVLQNRPPSVINLIALMGVIGGTIFAIFPLIARFVRWLDFSPTAITVAVIAMVAVIALIGVTAAIIQQSDAQYQAAINPPPQVINPVIPTSDALTSGTAALAACGWTLDLANDAFRELIERLPRIRDEELYALIEDGWRGQPACVPANLEVHWQMVNTLRSYEMRARFNQ